MLCATRLSPLLFPEDLIEVPESWIYLHTAQYKLTEFYRKFKPMFNSLGYYNFAKKFKYLAWYPPCANVCYLARPSARERESPLRRVVPLLDRAVGVRPAADDGHSDRRPEFFLVQGTKNSRPVAVIVPNGMGPAIRIVIRSRRLLGIPDPKRDLDLCDGLERVVPVRSKSKNNEGEEEKEAEATELPAAPGGVEDNRERTDVPEAGFRSALRPANDPPAVPPPTPRRSAIGAADNLGLARQARLSDPRDAAAVYRHLDHSEAVHERTYVSAAPVTSEQLYDIHARPDLRAGTSAEPHRPVEPPASQTMTLQPPLSLSLRDVEENCERTDVPKAGFRSALRPAYDPPAVTLPTPPRLATSPTTPRRSTSELTCRRLRKIAIQTLEYQNSQACCKIVWKCKAVIRSRRLLGIPDPKKGLDSGDRLGRVVPPGMSKRTANELMFPRPDSARPFDLPTILQRFRSRLFGVQRPELAGIWILLL
ncbi:unnamed protein product [Bemisia tabaci]|uniref:Uncharacterized protein n=1 Tax=Bemisia tabaci TaxID=7038 RepID=A0A9P0AMA3_BEMTA|nr:unnamed protein product [Bemisia tabaci]